MNNVHAGLLSSDSASELKEKRFTIYAEKVSSSEKNVRQKRYKMLTTV